MLHASSTDDSSVMAHVAYSCVVFLLVFKMNCTLLCWPMQHTQHMGFVVYVWFVYVVCVCVCVCMWCVCVCVVSMVSVVPYEGGTLFIYGHCGVGWTKGRD